MIWPLDVSVSEGESEERRRDEWRRGRGGVTRRAECRIKIIKDKKKSKDTQRKTVGNELLR